MDWEARGHRLETGLEAPGPAADRPVVARAGSILAAGPANGFVEAIGRWTIGQLLTLWAAMIVGLGLLYWVSGALAGNGLRSAAGHVGVSWSGLGDSIYFSFVTALSIGYGDVVPHGFVRVFAIAEGAAGLLIFGVVISKLVSRRQEDLMEQIHRIAFEDRIDRVRTNLHMILAEMQAISAMCRDASIPPEKIISRAESAAAVFTGELQTVHDLLYRPQETPEEEVLESILAGLAGSLRELTDMLGELPRGAAPSPTMRTSMRAMAHLTEEICGECVPRAYAPGLKVWMDSIHDMARRIP